MEKIKMTTPLVEMDGDEMTRILWKMIKDELILPFVDLKTEYYDLGLPNRDATADQVTMDAALANKKYGVSVKCATITPNAQRVEEYKLHEMWKSPNGTIRAVLDGTVFRAPIMIDSIHPVVKNWKKPITIARHAYGDVYKCTEFRIPGAGKAELVFTGADGSQQRATVFDFEGAGVLQGQYNKAETLNDRILRLRIDEGIRLLTTTDLTITTIAKKTGFSSSNTMYKAFMRVKGISPSSYRGKEI